MGQVQPQILFEDDNQKSEGNSRLLRFAAE